MARMARPFLNDFKPTIPSTDIEPKYIYYLKAGNIYVGPYTTEPTMDMLRQTGLKEDATVIKYELISLKDKLDQLIKCQ